MPNVSNIVNVVVRYTLSQVIAVVNFATAFANYVDATMLPVSLIRQH